MTHPALESSHRLALITFLTMTLFLSIIRTLLHNDSHLAPLTSTTFASSTSSTFLSHSLSTAQSLRFSIIRLANYDGAGRGFACYAHIAVSMLGILGMFAAIVGALLGPSLADTDDDDSDEDRFRYWAQDGDDEPCGQKREQIYASLRLVEMS